MPAHSIVKPSTATVVLKGNVGLDASDEWHIKIVESRLRFFTPLQEVTGDGDGGPVWDNNRFVYGAFTLTGWMLSNVALGIKELGDQGTPLKFQIFYDNDTSFPTGTTQAQSLFEQVLIQHNYRASVVGIAISGRFTTDDLTAGDFQVG